MTWLPTQAQVDAARFATRATEAIDARRRVAAAATYGLIAVGDPGQALVFLAAAVDGQARIAGIRSDVLACVEGRRES